MKLRDKSFNIIAQIKRSEKNKFSAYIQKEANSSYETVLRMKHLSDIASLMTELTKLRKAAMKSGIRRVDLEFINFK